MSKSTQIRTDDTGVLRLYSPAAPNRMFTDLRRACILFVRYDEKVPCALCGKQSRTHWTCQVRFKTVDLKNTFLEVVLPKRWTPAGKPVCRDHPMQPDEKEFLRLVRAAQRKARNGRDSL